METSLLIDSVAETTAHWDREDLDRAIAKLLLQFLEANSITIYRLGEVEQDRRVTVSLTLRASHSDSVSLPQDGSEESLPLNHDPAWQECIQSEKPVRCAKKNGRHLTLFPVRGAQCMLGILAIDTRQAITPRDADMVKGVLRILRNHLALLDYGEVDTLTGLLNRKTFESRFEKTLRRACALQATDEPSWLALVDIDRFKAINDGYGHLFGDEVLLLVSRLMQRTFRGADYLFRFGGEEFVIMLEHASPEGARIALERLRQAVELYEFPQVGRVTISIGNTQVTEQDVPTTCIQRADAALYYAKQHGRNCVWNFEHLVANGELVVTALSADVELF